jgi:hypothetical protein
MSHLLSYIPIVLAHVPSLVHLPYPYQQLGFLSSKTSVGTFILRRVNLPEWASHDD